MRPNLSTPASLALVFAAAAFSSCAGVPLPREQLTDPSALLFNGYAKPEVACYRCHNGDGKGTLRGPDLTKKVPEAPDAKLTDVIKNGKSFMPAFKDKLSDEEVAALVTWLRATFPALAAPAAAPKT